MPIDIKLREKFYQQQQQDKLTSRFADSVSKTVSESSTQQRKVIEELLSQDQKTSSFLEKIGKALVLINQSIPKKIELPKVFPVTGMIEVTKTVPTKIDNLSELAVYFSSLEKRIGNLATAISATPSTSKVEVIKTPSLKISNLDDLSSHFLGVKEEISSLRETLLSLPTPQIEVPVAQPVAPQDTSSNNLAMVRVFSELLTEMKKLGKKNVIKENGVDLSPLTQELSSLRDSLSAPRDDVLSTHLLRQISEGISNLAGRPTMIPQPVTNVWLNPNQGFLKTTDNTVGATLTKLPSYGQLLDRRSVLIYNNSANTIYIGGSDVTVATGLPVPASSYAPPIDAGYNLPIYGIASQGGNDVRVIEISKDQSGTVQE